MSRNLIITAAVVLVVIAGAILFLGSQSSNPDQSQTPTTTVQETPTPTPLETTTPTEEATEGAMMEKASVEIKNFAFSPKTLTVKKGTTVVFTNQDSVKHTATADDGSFDTGLLAKGESGSVTLDKVGTFAYHCTPHPNMKATIVVE